jgi:1-acyl-sn-glycerol-3-phosphate acyltransferase
VTYRCQQTRTAKQLGLSLGRWTLVLSSAKVKGRDVARSVRRQVMGVVGDWKDRGSAYMIVRVLTAPARRVLARVTVINPENLPAAGPVIVAANHISFFDSVLLMFALPRPVSMLGKAEYADNPVTKWLYCGAGMIPIRRENTTGLVHAFKQLEEILDRGEVLGIFPEGTRSRDGLLHRGRSGAAHLALNTGAPLVPIGIIGTDKLLPTGSGLVRPFQRVTIKIGQPIIAADLRFGASTSRARRAITDQLMNEVRRLCGQDYVAQYAPLPFAQPQPPLG